LLDPGREGDQVMTGYGPGRRELALAERGQDARDTLLGAEVAAGQVGQRGTAQRSHPVRVGIEVEGERHGHALAGWQGKGHIRGSCLRLVCDGRSVPIFPLAWCRAVSARAGNWAIYRTEQEAADQGPCTR